MSVFELSETKIGRKNKTKKVYFWLEPELLAKIDEACADKMISRSGYIRWVIQNYSEHTVYQINAIYKEICVNKKLNELIKR